MAVIKISIIIPIYNVEKYIEKCITSVMAQHDLPTTAFEIIIVDDESPDNSLAIAQKIKSQHSNIHIISQKNKGLGGARNTGIQNAKGRYLLFLDSDDYLLPKVLNDILDIAIQNDLDILEFGAQGILPDGKIVYEMAKDSKQEVSSGVTYYNAIKYMNSACNKLYRRELLLANNILFLEKVYIEDFEFNTRAFYKAKRVMAISTIVAHYLQSPDSITRNTDALKKEKMINDLVKVLEVTTHFANSITDENKSKATAVFFNTRLAFINTTLFYQLFKNREPYHKIKQLKERLTQKDLFYVNHSTGEWPKDMFRLIMLNNFWLFKVSQPLLQSFSKKQTQN